MWYGPDKPLHSQRVHGLRCALIDGRPNSRTARPMTCPCRGSKLSLGWQQGLNEGAAYPDFLPPPEAPSSSLASSGSHQRLPQGPMSGSTEGRQLGHAAWTTAAPGARQEVAIPHAPSRGRCVAWRALPRRRQPPGFSPLSNENFMQQPVGSCKTRAQRSSTPLGFAFLILEH